MLIRVRLPVINPELGRFLKSGRNGCPHDLLREGGSESLHRRCRVENGEEMCYRAEVSDFDALGFLDFCSKTALVWPLVPVLAGSEDV
ncbi:hypothetical protein A2U01_0071121, partial [Trifolium medium]|nr:hypothetical protein [Trifolium medium]